MSRTVLLSPVAPVAGQVKTLPTKQEMQEVRSLGGEDSPGEGNGNPLQCSCLENLRDGGVWWATVGGVAQSDATEHAHACSMHTEGLK